MENLGIELNQYSMIAIAIVCVAYVVLITSFGGYFARFNKNINDFFYSGQRFAWWLPAASMIATGIGSYSYLKYSEQGFNTGMSSTMTYMNDWFCAPFSCSAGSPLCILHVSNPFPNTLNEGSTAWHAIYPSLSSPPTCSSTLATTSTPLVSPWKACLESRKYTPSPLWPSF